MRLAKRIGVNSWKIGFSEGSPCSRKKREGTTARPMVANQKDI
jgi:hypothetical protein